MLRLGCSAHQIRAGEPEQRHIHRLVSLGLVQGDPVDEQDGFARAPAANVQLLGLDHHAGLERECIGQTVHRQRAHCGAGNDVDGLARTRVVNRGAHFDRREVPDHVRRRLRAVGVCGVGGRRHRQAVRRPAQFEQQGEQGAGGEYRSSAGIPMAPGHRKKRSAGLEAARSTHGWCRTRNDSATRILGPLSHRRRARLTELVYEERATVNTPR
jgi:hypothetical protein